MQDIGRTLTEAGGALFFCLLCVLILYGIVLSIIYPAILVMFAREGTFASCFKLREAFEMISKNAAAFFTAWGLSSRCQSWRGLARRIRQSGRGLGSLHWLDRWTGIVAWLRGLQHRCLCASVWSVWQSCF